VCSSDLERLQSTGGGVQLAGVKQDRVDGLPAFLRLRMLL
jgi:hypothetical protein